MFDKHEQKIIENALAIMEGKAIYKGATMDSPEKTMDYLRLKYGANKNESFGVIFLDTKHRIIAVETLFNGTIDSASVYIRPIAESVLNHGAAAVILFHNHPSGNPEPSQSDIVLTNRIRDALSFFDCRVLDHIVVGIEGCVSFAIRGLM